MPLETVQSLGVGIYVCFFLFSFFSIYFFLSDLRTCLPFFNYDLYEGHDREHWEVKSTQGSLVLGDNDLLTGAVMC